MLGKSQKARLETCARWAESDDVVLHIVIGKWIPYTREFGKGYPINVKMFYTSEPEGYDLRAYLSRCQYRHTVFDKAKEIARYLVNECGVPREKVSIKSKIGTEEGYYAPSAT